MTATLTELEAERQALALEQARQEDPWELISTPTVLDKPVAPRKKRMVALGLLGGLVLGCGAALVRDRRSGLVFSEDELKALLPGSMLERLPLADTNRWQNTAQLLVQGPLVDAQSVALIAVGELPKAQLRSTSTRSVSSARPPQAAHHPRPDRQSRLQHPVACCSPRRLQTPRAPTASRAACPAGHTSCGLVADRSSTGGLNPWLRHCRCWFVAWRAQCSCSPSGSRCLFMHRLNGSPSMLEPRKRHNQLPGKPSPQKASCQEKLGVGASEP